MPSSASLGPNTPPSGEAPNPITEIFKSVCPSLRYCMRARGLSALGGMWVLAFGPRKKFPAGLHRANIAIENDKVNHFYCVTVTATLTIS